MNRKGFSLLEVLVAIVVLSVVLGLIISLFGGGLRSVSLTNGYSEALLLAREKLDEEMVLVDIEEGDEDGESNGYRWEKRTEVFVLDDEEKSGTDPSLFQVSVRVSWEAGAKEKELVLQTLVAARN